MTRPIQALALFSAFAVAVVACSPAAPSAATAPTTRSNPVSATQQSSSKDQPAQMTEASLLTSWFPQPEDGGYYVAEQQGLFKAHNVNMNLKPGGPGIDVIKLVAAGQFKFGMAVADQIALARNEGVPVVALMSPFQTSPQIIMVHEESGIKNFDDIARLGTRVAVSSSAAYVRYLIKAFGWKEDQLLRYNGQIAEWLNDPQRATQGVITSEPFYAVQAGARPVSMLIAEFGGYNPYQKMLFTTEDTIKNEPELVHAVVAASLEGWRSYMGSPESGNTYLKTKSKDLTDDGMKFAYEAMKPLVLGGDAKLNGMGVMTQARWDQLFSQLKDVNLLRPELNAKDAWTDEFTKPHLKL